MLHNQVEWDKALDVSRSRTEPQRQSRRERTQAEAQGEGEAEKFTFQHVEFEVYIQRNLRIYSVGPQRTLKTNTPPPTKKKTISAYSYLRQEMLDKTSVWQFGKGIEYIVRGPLTECTCITVRRGNAQDDFL